MVAAIVIPIICLYFFWLTRKEMKEHELKWKNAGKVKEDALVTGRVRETLVEREKLYYHLYLIVQKVTLQTEIGPITVLFKTPQTKAMTIAQYEPGQNLRIFGTWSSTNFIANRAEILPEKKETAESEAKSF